MFNPNRLKIARQRRGMKVRDLSGKAKLSEKSILNYEAGVSAPNDESLKKLSVALSFPENYFYGQSFDEPTGFPSFRARTTMTKCLRDSVVAVEGFGIALDQWLESRFTLPKADLPDLENYLPEAAAQLLRNTWGLGLKAIPNMVWLLEAHGVRVFSLAEDCNEVDAFSRWHKRRPYVYLNTKKSGERSRFDAAHELGHLVLHQRPPHESHQREAEQFADQFAAAFLMPRDAIYAKVDKRMVMSLSYLIKLKSIWKVSLVALIHRLSNVQFLSEWESRLLWSKVSQAGYRKLEPKGMPGEASQIYQKIFSQLKLEVVSSDLNIPISELEKLVFGLVLRSLPGGNENYSFHSDIKPSLRLVVDKDNSL